MTARITKDEITPALKNLLTSLNGKRNIQLVVNSVKGVITNRTLMGQSLSGGAFKPYSTKTFSASVERRTPGTPTPKGGRSIHKKTGKKLKSRIYDNYASYKTAMGFGSNPQLSLTSKMLKSMQTSVINPKKAVIFFTGALQNTKAHGLHNGKFPFFGIRSEERKHPQTVLMNQLLKIRGMRKT